MKIDNNNLKDLLESDGVTIINADLTITYFNPAAEKLTGYKAWETVSKDCSFLFVDWEAVGSKIKNVLRGGISSTVETVALQTRSGETREIYALFTPILLSDQKIQGVLFVFQSPEKILPLYKSLKDKTRELINERNKLSAIFNSRLEGTFTIDKQCNITTFNRSAEKITGYSSSEALGQKCWEIFRSEYCRDGCENGRSPNSVLMENSARFKELYITRKDSRKVAVRVTTAPLLDAEGEHIGAVETFQDITELQNLSSHLEDRFRLSNIIGQSKSMERVYRLIEDVSKSNSTILITGDSGTGKELVASAIHLNSHRRTGPFAAINCSAFAETLLESEIFGHEKGAFTGAIQTKQGRFELAQGGTLFLDEIGDISASVQVKMLRVLETRQFERVGGTSSIKMDVRLIAATNKDISKMVESGTFREDFYYRINVINIHLPPLRDRIDDLPLLIQSLIDRYFKKFNKNILSVSPSALKRLKAYDWPGNIRELENVLEHAFVMCHGDMIDTDHLPDRFLKMSAFPGEENDVPGSEAPLQYAEKIIISQILETYNGHRGKTADVLGIDKTTLWRKMKKYDLL
ncbi:sigma 54-interacting transcriptional regulator [bacterium]|nr:sigma 54-interacting transcriptional regulator [bacterium]